MSFAGGTWPPPPTGAPTPERPSRFDQFLIDVGDAITVHDAGRFEDALGDYVAKLHDDYTAYD